MIAFFIKIAVTTFVVVVDCVNIVVLQKEIYN